ncbi:hypothetical protein LEP1GSC041_1199 [Leptospira noguchii str. 2006001870]|nr:hypothetical protein LEP1GSC041_1199 [Leptospira noguchii str. 2006001870]
MFFLLSSQLFHNIILRGSYFWKLLIFKTEYYKVLEQFFLPKKSSK